MKLALLVLIYSLVWAAIGFVIGDYHGYMRGLRRCLKPQTEQEWLDGLRKLKRELEGK